MNRHPTMLILSLIGLFFTVIGLAQFLRQTRRVLMTVPGLLATWPARGLKRDTFGSQPSSEPEKL